MSPLPRMEHLCVVLSVNNHDPSLSCVKSRDAQKHAEPNNQPSQSILRKKNGLGETRAVQTYTAPHCWFSIQEGMPRPGGGVEGRRLRFFALHRIGSLCHALGLTVGYFPPPTPPLSPISVGYRERRFVTTNQANARQTAQAHAHAAVRRPTD